MTEGFEADGCSAVLGFPGLVGAVELDGLDGVAGEGETPLGDEGLKSVGERGFFGSGGEAVVLVLAVWTGRKGHGSHPTSLPLGLFEAGTGAWRDYLNFFVPGKGLSRHFFPVGAIFP